MVIPSRGPAYSQSKLGPRAQVFELAGKLLAAAAANNYHIEDFTIEGRVLKLTGHYGLGNYTENLDPELKFLSRPGPPKSPATTASRTLKVGP
ncbi:hypothetical protein BY996DRAFT_6507586 [Phakopsora pachyrhizi]|nr:hypothetical protein BY996DRAFT_6507586 [Phakopsora pachyrhizi]